MSGKPGPRARAHQRAKTWWEHPDRDKMSIPKYAEMIGVNYRSFERHLRWAREAGVIPKEGRDYNPGPNGIPGTVEVLKNRWLEIENRDDITLAEAAKILEVPADTLRAALSRSRKRGRLDPSTARCVGSKRQRLDHEYIREEWEHLRLAGVHIEEAARRLGISPITLKKITTTHQEES